jgi:signal transduction histidine kinase
LAVLYTTVPYLWRRHLGILRALLALSGLAVYIFFPVPFAAPVAVVIGAYAAYSVFLLFKGPVETTVYPVSTLLLDFIFFLLCALHPAPEAVWLSTVCYMYVILFAALLYEWRYVLAAVLGTGLFFVLIQHLPAFGMWPGVTLGGTIAVVLAIQRHSLQERLSAALKRSVLSRSEAELAREEERQRIAHDFHDGPLQSFISFQMRLEIIRKLMTRDPESAMRELVQLQDLGRSQVTELRAFVRGMQPADVSPKNLSSAVREAVEHFERDSGIVAELYCGDLSTIDESVAGELLQIVREALNNARKHSKASRVTLTIESNQDGLDLAVEDDGSGFPFSGAYNLDELEILRLGPRSIKRRVRTLGGELLVDSRPTEGAALKIRIPAR